MVSRDMFGRYVLDEGYYRLIPSQISVRIMVIIIISTGWIHFTSNMFVKVYNCPYNIEVLSYIKPIAEYFASDKFTSKVKISF